MKKKRNFWLKHRITNDIYWLKMYKWYAEEGKTGPIPMPRVYRHYNNGNRFYPSTVTVDYYMGPVVVYDYDGNIVVPAIWIGTS